MKLRVFLPDEDVEFLDEYASIQGIAPRSAVLHKAVRLLRASDLGASYEDAWDRWPESDAELWDATAGDGLP